MWGHTIPLRVRLVGFNRNTDRAEVQYEVPRVLLADVLKIAQVGASQERSGDVPLTPARAEKIAKILQKPIDTKKCDFFLETSAPVIAGRRSARA